VVCVSGAQAVMAIERAARSAADAPPAPLQKGNLGKMAAPGGVIFGIVPG
jgi:hypothetical protein